MTHGQSVNDTVGDAGAGGTGDRGTGDDLTQVLDDLGRLSSYETDLATTLEQIAELAVHAIPGAEGAGLTLLRNDHPDLIVKSTQFVVAVDDIQYDLGEGPCVDAAATGSVMRSGSLGEDPRWPRFGPRVAALGVHSALSLPLITPTAVVGAMNIYAHPRNTFDAHCERVGTVFAAPAAISVQNAHLLAQANRLTQHLETALITRAVIDQAIGILRALNGLSAEEAFTRLKLISQHQNRKVADVATDLVDSAVQQARDHQQRGSAPTSSMANNR